MNPEASNPEAPNPVAPRVWRHKKQGKVNRRFLKKDEAEVKVLEVPAEIEETSKEDEETKMSKDMKRVFAKLFKEKKLNVKEVFSLQEKYRRNGSTFISDLCEGLLCDVNSRNKRPKIKVRFSDENLETEASNLNKEDGPLRFKLLFFDCNMIFTDVDTYLELREAKIIVSKSANDVVRKKINVYREEKLRDLKAYRESCPAWTRRTKYFKKYCREVEKDLCQLETDFNKIKEKMNLDEEADGRVITHMSEEGDIIQLAPRD